MTAATRTPAPARPTVPPCADDGRDPEDWFPAVESSSARSQPTAADRRALLYRRKRKGASA